MTNLSTSRLVGSLCAIAVLFAPGSVFAQDAHAHTEAQAHDTTAAAHSMDNMNMGPASDWRMEAMAKHMAYSSPRLLTTPDSVRAAYVINELRQAIAKYK